MKLLNFTGGTSLGVRILFVGLFLLGFDSSFTFAQDASKPASNNTNTQNQVRFVVVNAKNEHLRGVAVTIRNRTEKLSTDSTGSVLLNLPLGRFQASFKLKDYEPTNYKFGVFRDSLVTYTVVMKPEAPEYTLPTTQVEDSKSKTALPDINNATDQLIPIEPQKIAQMPLGSIERVITSLGGVGTTSEFSSQYRVRGGNFDENLIYINGIEIYRPMIVRTGQQEGLPITNANLAKNVTFNSGGFPAQYGDRLSSALNIEYQTPNKFRASGELGLLSQNAHVEGSSANKADSTAPGRWTYLAGIRRFSPSYLLNSLNTTGNYQPNFWDIQALGTFTPKSKRTSFFKYRTRKDGSVDTILLPVNRQKWSLFGILTKSNFSFEPQSRETTFGTVTTAIRLFIAFEGQEQTNYTTGQTAVMHEFRPTLRFNLKHTFSFIRSVESEITSIEGGYRLGDVNTDLGSKSFNEVVAIRGVGTELRNARNYLTVNVFNFEQRGEWKLDRNFYKQLYSRNPDEYLKHTLHWGWKLQSENIDDVFREWSAIDSADYVRVNDLIVSNNIQHTVRFSGFLQHTWRLSRTTNLVYGMRGNYWTLNKELLVSPRIQFVYDPTKKYNNIDSARTKIQYRLALGYYSQPPFFRELRNFRGVVDPAVRAQRSIHYIAGLDYVFKAWGREFKLYAELYYKQLLNIIPYEIENVRIRYYPQQKGTGFAYGLDTRVNGQFIPGIESWFSFSLLNTQEDVTSDVKPVYNSQNEITGYENQGLVPRPSDQRFIVSFYFQDELPRIPTVKVHLNFVYNSGLPFGPPQKYDSRTTNFVAPSYQRVDIGVSKLISFRGNAERKRKFSLQSLWIGLEVFNLLQRENTVSYTWISAINGIGYAVPNYLSNRLISLRVVARL